jgi:hypothetical protein
MSELFSLKTITGDSSTVSRCYGSKSELNSGKGREELEQGSARTLGQPRPVVKTGHA